MMYITRCNYYGIMRSSLGKILQEILTNRNNVSFLSFHSNFENYHFDFNLKGVILEHNKKITWGTLSQRYTEVESVLRWHVKLALDLKIHIGSISQSDSKFLTKKCYQSVHISSFMAYKWGHMPLLHVALAMMLPLCFSDQPNIWFSWTDQLNFYCLGKTKWNRTFFFTIYCIFQDGYLWSFILTSKYLITHSD